jgi:hypothetical protein
MSLLNDYYIIFILLLYYINIKKKLYYEIYYYKSRSADDRIELSIQDHESYVLTITLIHIIFIFIIILYKLFLRESLRFFGKTLFIK